MRPIDWLLLFLVERRTPLDPVRMQKGMFLLARQSPLPAPARYEFVPYAYGPMSRGVYRDARTLTAAGAVRIVAVPGRRWHALQATAAGADRARLLHARARRDHRDVVVALADIRLLVEGLSFAALLEYVYTRCPDSASASVFRRR